MGKTKLRSRIRKKSKRHSRIKKRSYTRKSTRKSRRSRKKKSSHQKRGLNPRRKSRQSRSRLRRGRSPRKSRRKFRNNPAFEKACREQHTLNQKRKSAQEKQKNMEKKLEGITRRVDAFKLIANDPGNSLQEKSKARYDEEKSKIAELTKKIHNESENVLKLHTACLKAEMLCKKEKAATKPLYNVIAKKAEDASRRREAVLDERARAKVATQAAKVATEKKQLESAKKSGNNKAKAKAARVLSKDELDYHNAQRDREHEIKLKKMDLAETQRQARETRRQARETRRQEREANRQPKKSFREHYRTAHSNIESTFGHQKSPLEKTKMLASGWVTAMQAFIEGFGFLGSMLGGLFGNILNADIGGGSHKADRQTKMANYHQRLLERKRLAREKRKELEAEKKQKDEEEKSYQRTQREKREEREHDLKMAKVTGKDSNSESDYF